MNPIVEEIKPTTKSTESEDKILGIPVLYFYISLGLIFIVSFIIFIIIMMMVSVGSKRR